MRTNFNLPKNWSLLITKSAACLPIISWSTFQLRTNLVKISYSATEHILPRWVRWQTKLLHWRGKSAREIVEMPIHSLCVIVWCEFLTEGVLGPYFFEKRNEEVVTEDVIARCRATIHVLCWKYNFQQNVIETRLRYLPQYGRNCKFIVREIFWPCNFSEWWHWVGHKIVSWIIFVKFDTELFNTQFNYS